MIGNMILTLGARLAPLWLWLLLSGRAAAGESSGFDRMIDEWFGWATGWFVNGVFADIPVNGYPVKVVVIWLALAGVVLTLFFKFINLTAFRLALRTVRGRYSHTDDPGEISHFQALSAALSGTVGLGNIAGVAIGIMIGGPGVALWLFMAGFLGMATKFAECTLGVKYREIDANGRIHGGAMYYLRKGFAERGLGPLGAFLAGLFAFFCVFASFGGGNVFQVNQATAQLVNVTGGENSFFAHRQWLFGLFLAVVGHHRGHPEYCEGHGAARPGDVPDLRHQRVHCADGEFQPHPGCVADDCDRGIPAARRGDGRHSGGIHLGHAPRDILERGRHRLLAHRARRGQDAHASLRGRGGTA
jgi:hypothetical protein